MGKQDQVGLIGVQDMFGLYRFGDYVYCVVGDVGFFFYLFGEFGLVVWFYWDFCICCGIVGRYVDQVYVQVFQVLGQFYGFVGVLVIFYLVGGGQLYEQW